MSKAILISIKPQWVAKILNKEKTIEIRKRFPKDYVGWVYIYCTRAAKHTQLLDKDRISGKWKLWFGTYTPKNRKVVARFWCDKVEEIRPSTTDNFTKDSCLTIQELENYLWSNILFGYAIHITNLEIFNKPKELSKFKSCKEIKGKEGGATFIYKPLTKPFQSWGYIWIE